MIYLLTNITILFYPQSEMDTFTSKVFYLRKKVIFPHCATEVAIEDSPTSDSLVEGEKILAYPIRSVIDVFLYRGRVATLAEVISISKKDGKCTLEIRGISRVKLQRIRSMREAEYIILDDGREGTTPSDMDKLRRKAQELVFIINVDESDKLIGLLNFLTDPGQMTDFIANYFVLDFRKRYRLLYMARLKKRVRSAIRIMDGLIDDIKKHKPATGDEEKHHQQ